MCCCPAGVSSAMRYGLPGMGKTKILQKFLRDHPFSVDETQGVSRMNVIGIRMPSDADERSFYEEVLGALDARIHYGHTVSQMRRTARDLMTFVDARMWIIDGLHALLGGTLSPATDFAECDSLSGQRSKAYPDLRGKG